ncbi:HAD family hydrolase [Vagococcus luciliae]|uniref:Phosphoglycolate phosphatase n=1 Tax=Vagococcus luciliae TaxID=2920380 RepID=A0ABY5NYZ6_9ENTE|nr:HAD family hydrolase [Vagococcus luciliae]UUV98884.1 Phosphoglycolate phosphatase [Vagococcus luciliae]
MSVVVFDVDDTLYEQRIPFEMAIKANFGTKSWFDDTIFLPTLYRLFRYHSDIAYANVIAGVLSLHDMRVLRIKQTLKDIGVEITDSECESFQACYLHEQTKIVVHPEMIKLLNILKDKNISTSILTNGPTDHQELKLSRLNLVKWIDEEAHHISESIGYSKPDATAFKMVEKSHPNETDFLYVGDSYDNDVVGAKSAGWKVIWLNKNNKRLTPEMFEPDVELDSYENIIETVLGLLQEE